MNVYSSGESYRDCDRQKVTVGRADRLILCMCHATSCIKTMHSLLDGYGLFHILSKMLAVSRYFTVSAYDTANDAVTIIELTAAAYSAIPRSNGRIQRFITESPLWHPLVQCEAGICLL